MEAHVIHCTFSDIPAQLTKVTWTPRTKTDGYTVKNGDFDPEKKVQISTLTIENFKLAKLRASVKSHTFTCKITVGSYNTKVAAVQTLTIFDPSKNQVKLSHNDSRESTHIFFILTRPCEKAIDCISEVIKRTKIRTTLLKISSPLLNSLSRQIKGDFRTIFFALL